LPVRKSVKPPPESSAPAFTHAAIANQYARDVVSGRVVGCKWVKAACQRHLDDLARARAGWRYYFDESKANHVCRFIEKLPHTKGDWANRSERISLQPWQCFILCVLFGWLKAATRTRRFSLAYIAVPRKDGKSVLAGGIGVYMFCADGEFGAEVYSGATTEKQAWEVFRPARLMVERTPALKEAFGITVGAKSMFITGDGSRFEPVIGKPGDGASPHCGIVDEYHEHDSDVLFDTLRTGMGARKQPLLLVITTAGDNLAGPCKALQEDLEKVLQGSVERDEFFGIVYTIDADDDWTSEAALRKANPNFGVSVFEDFLKTEQRNAVGNARKQGVFKTKHLNVWVGANNAYFNLQQWIELKDVSLDPREFRGLPCIVAFDIATKKDITARVAVFRKPIDRKDHYYVFSTFYLPEARVMQPEFQHYQKWVHDGHLTETAGATLDFERFQSETIDEIQRLRATEFCFDSWNATQLAENVARGTRATAIDVPQQPRHLSDPMKQLDALIADGRIHHDGNPVLTWMIGNVVAHTDAKDNVFPRKERDESKIDGALALIMALSRAVVTASAGVAYTGLRSVG